MPKYKCCQCGEEINSLLTRVFTDNGDDHEVEVDFKQVPHNAVAFEIGTNWVGYGVEEDSSDFIMCPKCKRFPFKSEEVQSYEYLRVVCFKK